MQILTHIHLPVTGRRHLPNIHPHSTQAQVNLPAVSDQLRAFKLAPGNLLSPHSLHSLRSFGDRRPMGRSPFLGASASISRPSGIRGPAVSASLRCALSSLPLTLPHTAAEGNMRTGSVAECCSTLSLSLSL